MLRRVLALVTCAVIAAAPSRVTAQGLSGRIGELIRFGSCEQALCLVTGEGNHQSHYIGAAQTASADLLSFITGAITSSIGRLPISSTSGGSLFTFVGGAPVRTTTSAGPIFAERGTTLGKGRKLIGANTTRISFSELRGVSTDSLEINLSHQDVAAPGLGDLAFENDVIGINLDLALNLQVTTFFATYGLADRVDVSVALPFVMSSLDGTGRGRIFNPVAGVSGVHFFGSANDPQLTATTNVSESAAGIGDIALRAKAQLAGNADRAVAFLADVRLPTGNDEQFHGSGSLSASGRLIASSRHGNFSPHANLGYAMRAGDGQNNAILMTLGFDHSLSRQATVAIDLLSEFQSGGDGGKLPATIQLQSQTVRGTNIPIENDNPMSLSLGGRFLIGEFTTVINGLIPVKSGGLQSKFAWTLGLERTF